MVVSILWYRFGSGQLTVNVLGLVHVNLTYGEFTVGCLSSTVTTGQIIDDECGNLVASNVFEVVLNHGDLGTCVAIQLLTQAPAKQTEEYSHPEESSYISNLLSCRRQSSVRDGCRCLVDLIGVELVGVDLAASEWVSRELDCAGACCTSSQWAIVCRSRGSESASQGRSQSHRVEALHFFSV